MLIAIIILGLLISPALAVSPDDAMTFLRDKTPPIVQEKFSRVKIEASPCVVEHGGVVYSLAAVPVRGAQNSFSMAAVRQASLRAAVNLARYLDNGKTITEGYGDTGAVNHVLLEHYELRAGFSSSGKVINDCAFALVAARKINAPISRKDFNTKYCEYLYNEGQGLFSSGRILFNAGHKDEGF
ncbi:MAG: hypothetical protein IJR85_02335 [Synergistaceae bacterium]|nr:hypothetical protein [Synergistaceae bacterium]